jgi:hypothetical protein
MNEIDKVQLMAELSHELCELNHGPNMRKEQFPASDYIVRPFGYAENELTDVVVRELLISTLSHCRLTT